ncbi:MAG: lipopolysaccharide kinase InaA family protein [Gammaproteobacteria bacterium]|nr:lipopolysaccharide kinase InaA family protein [Gammaproteobacteria bacterium]
MTTSAEDPEQLHECARQLAAGELPAGWDIVPGSSYSRVAVNAGLKVYYKEFRPRSPLQRLLALLRGSRVTRARRGSDALLYAGIEAPANLAWGSLPGGGEYMFTRAAAGQDVASWLTTTLATRSGEALATRRKLLAALGIFVGRVHATGFVPGELKPGDVLADLLDDRFQFTLINNERTVKKMPPPGRMLLRNLMELNLLPPSALSRTDRMRFFVGWRRQLRELSPIEAKVVAAEAYHWAMRLMYERGQL